MPDNFDAKFLTQRKAPSDADEEAALEYIGVVAASFLAHAENLLDVARPVSPLSELGKDDERTRPEKLSHRAKYALLIAADNTRAWAEKVRAAGVTIASDYALLRPIIESLFTVIWLLGPQDSHTRTVRVLQLRNNELEDLALYGRKLIKLKKGEDHSEEKQHLRDVAEQKGKLTQLCERALVDPRSVVTSQKVSYSTIVADAAEHVPNLTPALAYSLWSICSGMAHAQPGYALSVSDFQGKREGDDVTIHIEPSAYNLSAFLNAVGLLFDTTSTILNARMKVEQ